MSRDEFKKLMMEERKLVVSLASLFNIHTVPDDNNLSNFDFEKIMFNSISEIPHIGTHMIIPNKLYGNSILRIKYYDPVNGDTKRFDLNQSLIIHRLYCGWMNNSICDNIYIKIDNNILIKTDIKESSTLSNEFCKKEIERMQLITLTFEF